MLKTHPIVQNRFVTLQTLLQDSTSQIDIVEDKYGVGKQYLLTRFQYSQRDNQPEASLEEVANLVAKHSPKIPKVAGIYTENKDFFIIQDYINNQTSNNPISSTGMMPPRSEYELVALLNRLLPVLSLIHQPNFSGTSAKQPEHLRALTTNILSLTAGQSQAPLYNDQTGVWNGRQHLSDQRAQVLDKVLSADKTIPTADAFLQALNTLNPVQTAKPLPPIAIYLLAAGAGLLILVALISYLFSREEPLAPSVNPEAEQVVGCPSGSDILPIGCNSFVFDVDSPNFGGGTLSVAVSEGAGAGDRIFLQQKNVTVKEETQEIIYRDNTIGTLASSASESALTIDFNENATPEDIAALLQDVVYQNTADSVTSGTREISFQLSDGDEGDSESRTTTVAFYVPNKAPTVTVPTATAVTEDGEASIRGIQIADADAGESFMGVALSVNRGALEVSRQIQSGAQVQSEPEGRQVFLRGTVAQINQTLSGENAITYRPDPDFSGSDSLRVNVTDSGQVQENNSDWVWPVNALTELTDSATVPITIKAVNDPPVLQLERATGSSGASPENTESILPPTSNQPSSQQANDETNAVIVGDPSQTKNVRAGTNTDAALLFELPVGSRVQVLRTVPNADGFRWHEIYSPQKDARGWIASHLVERD